MCVSPVTLNQGGKLVTFSCGRCFECVRKRKLQWIVRLHSQMSVSDVAFFSLISYNPENYPDPDLPEKSEIQKLIKRLRKRLNTTFHFFAKDLSKPIVLKYFIVSEYGELRSRLHYHAIFFLQNVDPHEVHYVFFKTLLEENWNRGFCSAFELEHKTIAYTCKYLQKDYNMMLYSKGLGKDAYLKTHIFDRLEDDEIYTYSINGKLHPVPKSWQEELDTPERRSVALANIKQNIEDSPPKLLLRDRITLNNSFLRDNPINETEFICNNNLDILPNGEF